MTTNRILFVVNDVKFFISHRLPLAIASRELGYEVHVAAPKSAFAAEIINAGFYFHEISLSRSSMNLLGELKSLYLLFRLICFLKPKLLHLITIKPIVYGGIIARIVKIPAVVLAISGFGYLFTSQAKSDKLRCLVVQLIYSFILKHNNIRVIIQNPDDQALLLQKKICAPQKTCLIPGSGVDTQIYKVLPEPTDRVVVIMISRLLKDKGVIEYVNAAKILKASGVDADFLLIGDTDKGNPTFIDEHLIDEWRVDGHVKLLGYRTDIAQLLEQSNIVVLPSYREGMPKALLEAAACGRAIVTTDVPGCRDTIVPDKTGILVPVKDAHALALGVKRLINDKEYRNQLGSAGRILAEHCFDIRHIVDAHMSLYRQLMSN